MYFYDKLFHDGNKRAEQKINKHQNLMSKMLKIYLLKLFTSCYKIYISKWLIDKIYHQIRILHNSKDIENEKE